MEKFLNRAEHRIRAEHQRQDLEPENENDDKKEHDEITSGETPSVNRISVQRENRQTDPTDYGNHE